uniref:Uncharacterized protein n=1 Tax=Anguilla anguilla TaxID=7936 RepID=A0A0E9W6R0_ANGAN
MVYLWTLFFFLRFFFFFELVISIFYVLNSFSHFCERTIELVMLLSQCTYFLIMFCL